MMASIRMLARTNLLHFLAILIWFLAIYGTLFYAYTATGRQKLIILNIIVLLLFSIDFAANLRFVIMMVFETKYRLVLAMLGSIFILASATGRILFSFPDLVGSGDLELILGISSAAFGSLLLVISNEDIASSIQIKLAILGICNFLFGLVFIPSYFGGVDPELRIIAIILKTVLPVASSLIFFEWANNLQENG